MVRMSNHLQLTIWGTDRARSVLHEQQHLIEAVYTLKVWKKNSIDSGIESALMGIGVPAPSASPVL